MTQALQQQPPQATSTKSSIILVKTFDREAAAGDQSDDLGRIYSIPTTLCQSEQQEQDDAFLKYSNDTIRLTKLKAGEEGYDTLTVSTATGESSSDSSRTTKRRRQERKTKISFELHPHAMLMDMFGFDQLNDADDQWDGGE